MMKRKKIALALLGLVLWAQSFSVFAFETDQYNLPDEPLADIGAEVSAHAAENIRKALEKINAEILKQRNCLEKRDANCDSAEKTTARLAYLRSEEAIARTVFKPLGGGIPPFTNSGTWMESHKFRAQPARYKTSFGRSIYRTFPTNYLTISETVRLYGIEFGTDKIAHIFQQGYTYYRIVERAKAKNLSAEEGVRRAVGWGRMSERTFYGYWASGVFSNADLAANYAGMKFYENLTREVKVGNQTIPPILILRNGVWVLNGGDAQSEILLKPFISEHLNEALNPSVYYPLFGLRSSVRRTVEKKACPAWRRNFPDIKREDFARMTESLKLWHGEDYGLKESDKLITIANACFD